MAGEMSDLEIHEVFRLHGIGGCEPGNLFHGTLIARRLRALERVVEAARDALTIHGDVACSCRGCQRIRTALAELDKEVGGDQLPRLRLR